MSRNPGEQWKDFSVFTVEERDPQQITDLIEQLNRDLEETQKHASNRQ
jgi:hypothetical protein